MASQFHWLAMAPYNLPPFGRCAIYFHCGIYLLSPKKSTPVGMGMFGKFFVHPPILTTKRPKSFSVTGLRTSEGISISYDTIKDYHDIKIYKAYVIIVLSHVIWYYINWVDWTIDEFQVFVCYMTTCLMFCFSWTLLHFRFNQSWTVWIGCMNLNCLLNVNILSVARYTITCIDRSDLSCMYIYDVYRCV